jgi:hypothetical protein
MDDIDKNPPSGWKAHPEFRKVARLVQQYCDPMVPYCPVEAPGVFSRISYSRFLEAPDEFIEEIQPERVGPGRNRHTTILHTPKGDLFWVYDEDEGIDTDWDIRKPICAPSDVERMLSVPYRFTPPDPADFEPIREQRKIMGHNCLSGTKVVSMVAMLVGMMKYELVLEWILTEPGLIEALGQAWLERTKEKVGFLLDQGVGPFWYFDGVERACPPMMGPRQWQELIVPYDGEIMQLIKARDPESKIHVHCHGKVGRLLPLFLQMGVNSTDPVEPPPQGDITFQNARRLVGDRMVLFGNIEFVDMEWCSADEIESRIRRVIEDGGKKHMVLMPSTRPVQLHTKKFSENAIKYIEAGLKYGRY